MFNLFAVVGLACLAIILHDDNRRRLRRISKTVIDNNQKLEKIMATEQEFNDRLDAIDTALTDIAASQTDIAADITLIKESVAGQGLPEAAEAALFAKLDGIAQKATATAQALKALADENVPPAPPTE